jgi:uncharacterized membrane protein
MPWLFLAYPVLAHLATLAHSQRLAWLALVVLFLAPLLPALRNGRVWAWGLLVALILVLYLCAMGGMAGYLMYLPPVLIPGAVLFVFARTLRAGRTPLVTQMATQIRGELPPELRTYTRRVTEFWVGLLFLLAMSSAGLALFASPEWWSLMTNIVQYLVLAAVFLLEYLYRRRRFRHLQHESFAGFVGALFKMRTL